MRIIFLLILLSVSGLCMADEEKIRASMLHADLGARIEFIEPSPMAGLYTVALEGGRVLYASADGRFFIQGRLYQAADGKTINLTDQQEREGIARTIANLDESEMIVFPSDDEKAVVTVFTDTTCPFCHKLHEEIEDINEAGITIRYLAYPRQGLKSDAYENMVSVWCSEDRRKAFSDAIDNDRIKASSCDNPVKKHYLLGQQIGLQGTPTLIFQDGLVVSGYRPAETIRKMAESIKSKAE
ncbi:bifunctional protein-disulfide isomerase/oxidoreductase DsbC [Alloalcanivorax sp. C16-1]|uniref:bifunctional protein-disulfide isomerase/oxidoreductase DsbC n=1 Tax=Alloalcanivorax sp. C16-1 TaxID=3390051 RepID=UPI003970EA89